MRRVSGLNVNGWHDFAARDWDPDEPDELLLTPIILDGGSSSVAIRQENDVWMGGPQAALAPHGRGNGWGSLGAADRRISIASVWQDLECGQETITEALVATVDALARDADSVMLAVPDLDNINEATQDRLLKLFSLRRGSCRLLWKPVALFLHAVEIGLIGKAEVGKSFCFLIHSSDGFEMQRLRLREDIDHPGHLAPERDGYGACILHKLGLVSIERDAHSEVLSNNPALTEWGCEDTNLGLQIICGDVLPGTTQVLRHNNGNWLEIVAPNISIKSTVQAEDIQQGVDKICGDGPVDGVFFTTPVSAPFSDRIECELRKIFKKLTRLEWNSLALGSLQAGKLIERGLPHYFDRLTPIRLAILRDGEPCFEDLVGSNETLPANREYVSPPYRNLVWGSGKTEIDFYILKGDNEIRHWRANLETPPRHNAAVELRLRQTPGQSWAKLSLTSAEWEPLQRNPIYLDWVALKPIDQTPEEILDELRTPPPTIPIRIIEAPNFEFWQGSARYQSILEEIRGLFDVDPKALATLLSKSMRDPVSKSRFWPIGTDGEFPEELTRDDQECFLRLLDIFANDIQSAIDRNGHLADNSRLRCLTWAFTLCPNVIQEAIVDGLEADLAGRGHVLLSANRSRTVLTQGAGRAVSSADHLRRVLAVLVKRNTNNDTLNAISMILSRRAEAPKALSADLVGEIAKLVLEDLAQLVRHRSFKTRFKNALSALAGMFRYREVEPFALLAGRDPMAMEIQEELERIKKTLNRNIGAVPQRQEKLEMIYGIEELLQGAGDPNILIRIEKLEED